MLTPEGKQIAYIVETLETVVAIDNVRKDTEGLAFDYADDAEPNWDSQKPVEDRHGRVFLDEDRKMWSEDQLFSPGPCPGCRHLPLPEHFASDRNCAFKVGGNFDPNNWNCGTIVLLTALHSRDDVHGMDHMITVLPGYIDSSDSPFGSYALVFSRYKSRGALSQAVVVEPEGRPVRQLTLELAERIMVERIKQLQRSDKDHTGLVMAEQWYDAWTKRQAAAEQKKSEES